MNENRFMKLGARILIVLYIIILCLTFTACNNGGKSDIYEAETINPNASPNTKKLMGYLEKSYKSVVLSGQYINTFEDFTKDRFLLDINDKTSWSVFLADEMVAINKVTSDYPIILGLDTALIPLGRDQATIDFAKEWHEAGGIVTMCWHWFAPGRETNNSFYTKDTDFNLEAALSDKQGADYAAIIADIDSLSEELKLLAEADVPVLWRPLHEASGGWFWWGASGRDSYLELYDLLYERMTIYHGLNNLIWVANAQKNDWYVGDDKCDILADDPYYYKSLRSFYEADPVNSIRFRRCYETTPNKIIAMTENEYLPDIDRMFSEEVYWSMFVTWCREYVCLTDENGYTLPEYGDKYATAQELYATYKNARVITLGDKPRIYR